MPKIHVRGEAEGMEPVSDGMLYFLSSALLVYYPPREVKFAKNTFLL